MVKSLFFEAKDKRLSRIISIKSPSAFKSSIKQLKKNGLTLKEKRALVLAQNRAKAILEKKNLSMKERKEFIAISKIKLPKISARFTSVNDGHRHKWNPKKMFTSFDKGHRHKINLSKGLALRNNPKGHFHKLLMR